MKSPLLPTSSVEMKTEGFSSYVKAGLVFAATPATYFLAKATGVLPAWFWNSETSSNNETPDTALTVLKSSSLVIEKIPQERATIAQVCGKKQLAGRTENRHSD